jgi:hypothetical protein
LGLDLADPYDEAAVKASFHQIGTVTVALVLAACAEPTERPRTEDEARLVAPLPACVVQASTRSKSGVAVSLKEEGYWRLVYPAWDGKAEPHVHACTGADLAKDPLLAGGAPLHDKVEEGDVQLAGGGDRLRAAWLRSVKFEDGTVGGAFALVRASAAAVELFAVGTYRGHPEKVRISIERLGPEVIVVATDDGCTGRAAGAPCDATSQVFLPREGELKRVAKFAIERVAYKVDSEPGIRGRFEYRLSSAPSYLVGGIALQEQVTVKDDLARDVRKAELNRSFTFGPGGDNMVASDDSLWTRIFPGAPKTAKNEDDKKEAARDE